MTQWTVRQNDDPSLTMHISQGRKSKRIAYALALVVVGEAGNAQVAEVFRNGNPAGRFTRGKRGNVRATSLGQTTLAWLQKNALVRDVRPVTA